MQEYFGYNSPLKDYWRQSMCAYTNKPFSKKNPATFEHIKPHSHGGGNGIDNCLLTLKEPNNERGSMPFDKWLRYKPEAGANIQNFLNKMRGLKINGKDYVETVKPTLNREAKGVVTFTGNDKPESTFKMFGELLCELPFMALSWIKDKLKGV